MQFLNPIFLWAVPMIAIPIAIHMLSKRRREVIRWGAMRFLHAGLRRKKRLWRLRDLLLLALRVLAVLLLVSAVSRPMVSSSWLTGGASRDVVIVLDNSMSTARRGNTDAAFDKQLKTVRATLDDLAADDAVRILLTAGKPNWLREEPGFATKDRREQIAARLDELEPTRGDTDIVAALNACLDAEPAREDMTRVIVVVSDGQAHSWRPDAPDAWLALKSRFDAATPRPVVNVAKVPMIDATENLAVDSLRAMRATAPAGETINLTAKIRNHGEEASAGALLNWYEGERHIGVSSLPELDSGAESSVHLQHTLGDKGIERISCVLDVADSQPLDDRAEFVVEVVDAVSILVVDGTSDPSTARSDTAYLLAAIGAEEDSAWKSVFVPTVIRPDELDDQDLSRFHCVVLANAAAPTSVQVDRFTRYVSQGGGLWIALGDQTAAAEFNEAWYRNGNGPAPLKLVDTLGDTDDREEFTLVRPPEATHPATRMLADTERLDIDRFHVFRRHQFADTAEVSVLMRLEHGEPLAMERTIGSGRLIIQGVPLGVAWSNLPLTHSFVALTHEWLWYLSAPSLPQRNLERGDPIRQIIEAEEDPEPAELLRPDGSKNDLDAANSRGQFVYRSAETYLPGIYELTAMETNKFAFSVRHEPGESDLAIMTDEHWDAPSLADVLRVDAEALSIPKDRRVVVPPEPIWETLLTALTIIMLIEIALAAWIARGRITRAEPVAFEQ